MGVMMSQRMMACTRGQYTEAHVFDATYAKPDSNRRADEKGRVKLNCPLY